MSGPVWRLAGASVIGSSHERMGLPCQDRAVWHIAPTADGEAVLVAAVADGAGSARHAEIGARLACERFADVAARLLATGHAVEDFDRDVFWFWLDEFQADIAEEAERVNAAPRDFACTVLAAVVGETGAAFAQIGDGAIVVSGRDDPGYGWVFWPQKGEYENQTMFATEPAAHASMHYAFVREPLDEVALFTDGLQRIALHFETLTAHAPFFRPLFTAVMNATDNEETVSAGLAGFLAGSKVDSRTDDDRTLVLATRRVTPPKPTTAPAPKSTDVKQEPDPAEDSAAVDAALDAHAAAVAPGGIDSTADQVDTVDTEPVENGPEANDATGEPVIKPWEPVPTSRAGAV